MDEIIAELESDKATFELTAEIAGTLKIVAAEGDTLEIGAVVCRIEEGGAKEFSATAMPIGRYEMYLYDTMLFGDIPVFKDVPGFSYCGIQPKSGNESLLGCVEVGEYRTLNGVSCSEGVLHKLRAMMRKAKADGRKVFCTITREVK